MKRSGGIGKAFIPILVILLVQNIVSIVGVEILVMIEAGTFSGGDFMDFMGRLFEGVQSPTFLVYMNIAYATICVIWFGIWYYNMTHNRPVAQPGVDVHDIAADINRERKGLFEGYRWPIIPGMIVLALGMQYLCSYLMNFVATLQPAWLEQYQKMMDMIGLTGEENMSVALIIYAILLGPASEELSFRGLTFLYARRSGSFWLANILQAFLFGLLHLNPLQGIYAFAVGIILGMIYERSRNIVVTIIIHILFNFAGTMVGDYMTLGDNAIAFYFILLGSLIVTYIGYEMVVRSIPKRVEIEEKFF
ncbi:MAG: CPBP family intramembrane metalloprotease [Lachnospiraceae bacterium]|nr:CPBP family intramembrane metalloprotease [Lachnospiraceae bacterium]